MARAPQALMVFVDGLGMGPDDPARNPVFGGACPFLARLLAEASVPVDAGLGVPGPPQSATGQATLLTGMNVAAAVGRHVEGLPGPRIKEIVRADNLFLRLASRGYRATFANAYFTDDMEEVRSRRRQSVTTVAALAAFGRVRDTAALLRNRAVYQDLTREYLRGRGYEGPLVQPREAGRHLLEIAAEHDFTLFEYFQTDLAAHKGAPDDVRRILGRLDEFLQVLESWPGSPERLFLLTSDHGNIEDAGSRLHTLNPVPLAAVGAGAEVLKGRVKSLADFVPALLDLYPQRGLET